MDEQEVIDYNAKKKAHKLYDLKLEKTAEGKEKLTMVFESSEKLSKKGKNILDIYEKNVLTGKTVQITIYHPRN